MQGTAYMSLGRDQDAIEVLEGGLMYAGRNARVKEQFYINLASAYNKLGDFSSSDSYFEKALEINSSNPLVLNNYAYFLALRGDKLDKALEMTTKRLLRNKLLIRYY